MVRVRHTLLKSENHQQYQADRQEQDIRGAAKLGKIEGLKLIVHVVLEHIDAGAGIRTVEHVYLFEHLEGVHNRHKQDHKVVGER